MLIDIESGRTIDRVPFKRDFDVLRNRPAAADVDAMVERINELIDQSGGEIATAGWLSGSDWSGTPFASIYTRSPRERTSSARRSSSVSWSGTW